MTTYTIDAFGIQRSTLNDRTPEGRIVAPGTTLAAYRAMLAAEQTRFVAAVAAQNDPRLPRPAPSRLPGRWRQEERARRTGGVN